MNKSEHSNTSNISSVLTRKDIGKRVKVAKIGIGVLRYVGNIAGKGGIFCGIELPQPSGIHDGSHQGVCYFKCKPLHGVFVPCYKVELENNIAPNLPKSSTFTRDEAMDERLSRSALPELCLKNVARPASNPPAEAQVDDMNFPVQMKTEDVMLQSAGSSIMDNSLKFSMDEDEDNLLTMVLPKASTLLRHLKPTRISELCAANKTSKFVEDETPLAENFPSMPDDYSLMMTGIHPQLNLPNAFPEEINLCDKVSDLGISPTFSAHLSQESLHVNDDHPTPLVEHADHKLDCIPKAGDVSLDLTNATEKKALSKGETDGKQAAQASVTQEKQAQRPAKTSPRMTTTALKRLEAVKKLEKNTTEPKIKKPTLKELQEASPAPRFPLKQKQSKHALVMQQMKQSIEAEKQRQRKKELEREREAAQKKVEDATKKAQAVKMDKLNPAPPTSKVTVHALQPKIVKPLKEIQKDGRPAAYAVKNAAIKPIRQASNLKNIQNVAHLCNLKKATKIIEGLSVAVQYFSDECKQAAEDNHRLKQQSTEFTTQNAQMTSEFGKMQIKFNSEIEQQVKALTAIHDQNINALQSHFEALLLDKENQLKFILEEEREKHRTEIIGITRNHQIVCEQLDEKIAEAEQASEKLRRDRKSLQTVLAHDIDSKVQLLSAEITSLQTALALKSQEMKELRQQNQSLIIQADQIPGLNLEIAKLKHKVASFSEALTQKNSTEKALVYKYEALKRRAEQVQQLNEAISKNMDVLRYRLDISKSSDKVDSLVLRGNDTTFPSLLAEESLMESSVSLFSSARNAANSSAHEDADSIYAPDTLLLSNGNYFADPVTRALDHS